MKKERIVNYDLIRCVALFLLVSVHFMLNTGFYQTTLIGKRMYIATAIRTVSMSCIPLFLLLTGALMHKKELNKKYYHGLIKILLVYVITMVFNYTFYHYYLEQELSLKILIMNILRFIDSAWYINLYIGLFLIIPFLNRLFNSLNDKEQKYLIITFLCLTALPSVINIFDFNNIIAFIKNPSISYNYTQIIPNWYVGFYPLTYYFLGAYLSENKTKQSKLKIFGLWLLVIMISSLFNIYRYRGNLFLFESLTDWASMQNVLCSSLIFLFCKNINLHNIPNLMINILKKLSDLEYAAYLVSPVAETVIYGYFKKDVFQFTDRLYYYPIIVLLILISSLILSFFINCLYKLLINIKSKKSIIILSLFVFSIICIKLYFKYYPHWEKYDGGNNPILGSQETGTLFDPFVMYDDGKYKMYVSKRNIGSIVVYESEDGINWSNDFVIALAPSNKSKWENIVNRATVMKYNDKYYMYYTGQYGNNGTIENSNIGLAISEDGYTFKRYGNNPILDYKDEENADSVMNPYVFYDEDDKIFKMYYASGETFEPDRICYAISNDGIKWEKYENNPILKKSDNKRALDNFKVGAVDIIKVAKNSYVMYYIGYEGLYDAKIFKATSNDGINWKKYSYTPIVKPAKNGWDSSAVYKPSVVFNEKRNEWFLYYNGRRENEEYIGLSILNSNVLQ